MIFVFVFIQYLIHCCEAHVNICNIFIATFNCVLDVFFKALQDQIFRDNKRKVVAVLNRIGIN